jgi:hypothetical protein
MVVDFMGGLGNQMFQYAFGRTLALINNHASVLEGTQTRTDLRFRRMTKESGHIRYMLDAYKLGLSWDFDDERQYPIYGGKVPGYDENVFDQAFNTRFIGYWQSERYYGPYAHVIRGELANPRIEYDAYTASLGQEIVAQVGHSAFVHVRRGDYLIPRHATFHGNLDNLYYAEAMDIVKQTDPETKFFVFSDDSEWCKQNFPSDITVIESNDRHPGWDIWLMSLCQYGIIANSSFSWWGAWLGDHRRDGLVIAPKKWFKADVDETGIVPDRWRRV